MYNYYVLIVLVQISKFVWIVNINYYGLVAVYPMNM